MGEWKSVDLAEVSEDISYGYTASAAEEAIGPKFLRITDIVGGTVNWATVPYCPINEKDMAKYRLMPGDIVIARTGATTGANYTVRSSDPKDVVFASYLIRYRIDRSKALPDYVGYCLRSSLWNSFVEGVSGGSAQPGANAKVLGGFEFDLPELPEQRAIASVLSCLDAKIDLLHRQNKTLEAMAEALFRQWFVEEAEEGWEEVRLGTYIGTNERSLTKDSPLVSIKYLDTGAITKGHIEGFDELAMKDAPSRARRLVQHNDIVYSTVRPIHCHYGMIKDPPDDLVVSTGFCVVTAKTLGPHFVYYLLTTPDMTEFLHSVAEGSTSTYPSLKPSDIEAVEFQLPPKKRREEFETIAVANWDRISNNYRQIKSLTALRDTLLPKLMSGEVRVEAAKSIVA